MLRGYLEPRWLERLGGETLSLELLRQNGTPVTVLNGILVDQAALQGILARIFNFGMLLLYVNCVAIEGDEVSYT